MNDVNTLETATTSDLSVIRWAPVILVLFVIALSPLATAFYWAFTH
ncbi:hypothetical protein [Saccharospirillum impatiens]|nr:hypothetical protein [Saccharospirillum impatiens]